MKKVIANTLAITACAALCALVWATMPTGGQVTDQMPNAAVSVETAEVKPEPQTTSFSDDEPVLITMQSESNKDSEILAAEEDANAVTVTEVKPVPTTAVEAAEIVPSQVLTPMPTPQPAAISADPYHTDVYPNNVYSEELLYDADGNLIGNTITYPCAFGPDAIWIDGHAYYDLPGFGLIEWSGPNQVTEDYTMYESGVKVGAMGGEEAPSYSAAAPALELPEPTGEVIDQTINMRPEKSSTPPDYKPDTTPPAELVDGE